MILGFTQHWPKEMGLWGHQPTNFVERIWESIDDEWNSNHDDFKIYWAKNQSVILDNDYGFGFTSDFTPKLHTIRQDATNRWKEGNDIHFYINVRKRNMFNFAPVVKVKSVQIIQIKHSGERWRMPWVMIDGSLQTAVEIKQLAINDGFETVEQFFTWFNEDFTGKIIHWTNLKY
tara:strand:+ start:2333 stop:2857 length:525 start_codon:yes stop_codon:yes gene_type:complete